MERRHRTGTDQARRLISGELSGRHRLVLQSLVFLHVVHDLGDADQGQAERIEDERRLVRRVLAEEGGDIRFAPLRVSTSSRASSVPWFSLTTFSSC